MPTTAKQISEYRSVFQSGEAFATTLITILVDHYGTECFEWAPETLKMEIEDDFQVKVHPRVFDRLMVGIDLLKSDSFYTSLPDFVRHCNILSGDTYDPRAWDPADTAEIAWGITEALLLSPPDDDNENPFTDEIVAYIGAAVDAEGIINPPDVLNIAFRDKDPTAHIQGEFSDDPAMFGAIYELEASKTEDINAQVIDNLRRLAGQLQQLWLRNGNAESAVKQMLQSFGRDRQTN
jgi:hypothetical protein